MLKHSLTIRVVERTLSTDVSRNRSVKRVKTTTLDPGLNPEETNTKSASSESPKEASERCCDESA
jgi:hypothetical protein